MRLHGSEHQDAVFLIHIMPWFLIIAGQHEMYALLGAGGTSGVTALIDVAL